MEHIGYKILRVARSSAFGALIGKLAGELIAPGVNPWWFVGGGTLAGGGVEVAIIATEPSSVEINVDALPVPPPTPVPVPAPAPAPVP